MKEYRVQMEISGSTAMWTRPDTGDAPISYPAPTFAAVKGIFESILWLQQAEIIPEKAEICKPVVYHNYTTNYGGPLRKSRLMNSGDSFQLIATVLINVCYRLYARIQHDNYGDSPPVGSNFTRTTNGAHAYQSMFNRRLKRGQCYTIPCLGWKEFTPDYIGDFRSQTTVAEEINYSIPSMLRTCFPSGKSSCYDPIYDLNVKISKGVLYYA